MTNKLRSMLGGAGFYAVLFACLAAVGLGAYFLLFRDGTPAAGVPASVPATVPASVSDPVAATEPELPVKPPVVEAVNPQPIQEDPEPTPVAPVKGEEPAPALDPTPVVATAPSLIVSPLSGQVVAAFSADTLAYNPTLDDWRTHDGVDIAAAAGTNVLAASAGTVLSVGDDDLLGTTVTLGHAGGYVTTYANLQAEPTVSEGEKVSAGQIIGAVGDTAITETAVGPHLHFSVSKDDQPIDPDEYLNS